MTDYKQWISWDGLEIETSICQIIPYRYEIYCTDPKLAVKLDAVAQRSTMALNSTGTHYTVGGTSNNGSPRWFIEAPHQLYYALETSLKAPGLQDMRPVDLLYALLEVDRP
jgi:hypothetical protein